MSSINVIPFRQESTLPRRAYRVKELVQILGLPKSTLHDMIRRGEIRAVAIGTGHRKIILVPVEEVDRLLGTRASGGQS